MNRLRLHISTALSLMLALASAVQAAPVDIVFGNLGPNGTDPLSSTNTDIGPSAATVLALAQGFTTGSASPLTISAVTIGAFGVSTGTVQRSISIYSNAGGVPGTALFTSATTAIGAGGKYQFNFSNAVLNPSTAYWVVPDFSSDWSWYLEATEGNQPTGQNSSGYTYLGTKRQTQASPGTWSDSFLPYSVSVTAVPEPATIGMAIAGLAAAGYTLARRRMRKA